MWELKVKALLIFDYFRFIAEIPSQLARVLQDSNLPYVILDDARCAPRPELIEVPQPKYENAFYFPFFVTLHRCGGSCGARPFETSCQLQGKSNGSLVK